MKGTHTLRLPLPVSNVERWFPFNKSLTFFRKYRVEWFTTFLNGSVARVELIGHVVRIQLARFDSDNAHV